MSVACRWCWLQQECTHTGERQLEPVPSGTEAGIAWAIDLGGSNLRVLQVGLAPGAAPRVLAEHKVTVSAAAQAGKSSKKSDDANNDDDNDDDESDA